MNYAEYLRRQTKARSNIIGFQNGQDASQVTYKAAAKVQQRTNKPIATSYSTPGGSIANIVQTSVPTTCGTYSGVSDGSVNADKTALVMGTAVGCAVCSDAPSSEPYNVVVPGVMLIDPPKNAVGVLKCCKKDYSQLFRNNNELTAQQGKQSQLRVQYNLPNKLQGLRGPIIINQ